MDAGDTAPESVCHVKKGGVAVGDLGSQSQELCRNAVLSLTGLDGGKLLRHLLCPDAPVPKQSSGKIFCDGLPVYVETERCQEIRNYIVVISGVESYFVPTGGSRAASDQIQSLVSVEGGAFHGHYVLDVRKPFPVREGKAPASN